MLLTSALAMSLVALIPAPASAAETANNPSASNTVPARAKNGWAYDMVRADEAHALGFTGRGIRVAILDNGIDPRAKGITGKVAANFDAIHAANGLQEHGTATAGIVAAETNAEAGIGGVAPDVEILNVKVCVMSNCRTEAMIPGLRWAIDNGADVISMSIGGPGVDAAVASLIKEATEKGIVVVAAAGNTACIYRYESWDGTKDRNCTKTMLSRNYPGFYPSDGVITVGAVDRERKRANYSSYNAEVDIAAPGTGVSTTFPWGPNADFGGTSAATPVVAGVAALVLQAAPSLTAAQVQSVLQMSASPAVNIAPDVWDSCVWNATAVKWDCLGLSPATWPSRFYTGAGVVDAVAAVELALQIEAKNRAGAVLAPRVTPSSTALSLGWSNIGLGVGPYKVKIDGDLVAETANNAIVLNDLINEATYSITVTDASGLSSLPALGRPSSAGALPVITPSNFRVYADGIYFNFDKTPEGDGLGALLFSDGRVVSCRQTSCDYSMPAGTATARYVSLSSTGKLSEPSSEITFTSTLEFAAPENIQITDITATTVNVSWGAVPGAQYYYYYDAGAGEWKTTTETHASISGLNTALPTSFRVVVSTSTGGAIGVWCDWRWYYPYPPELEPFSGVKVTDLSDSVVNFAFDLMPDAERMMFVRSDGKMLYQPANSPGITDRYSADDNGKTYTYWFVAIDDLKYGTQYGKISPPYTVTVPYPRTHDRVEAKGSGDALSAGNERQFTADVVSGRTVDWQVSGPCEKVSTNKNILRVRATNGVGTCVIGASVSRDLSWFEAGSEIRFDVVRALDTISLSGMMQSLQAGKFMDVRATTKSGRVVTWGVGSGCSFKGLGLNRIRVKAETGTGSCRVSASLDQTNWWNGATYETRQALSLVPERITMASTAKMLDRKSLVLSFKTVTGRSVSFKSTGMCTVKRLSSSKFQVSSRYTSGACTITASFAANSATTAASSKLIVKLQGRLSDG
jgi:hypothetical protein